MIADNIDIIHLIQLSVAPVFLLAGVAGLLNVFTSRLARIIDRLERIDNFVHEQEDNNPKYKQPKRIIKRREILVMRMQNINRAIFFCTTTGLLVAMVIMSVFLSALFSFDSSVFISVIFVLSMVFLALAFIVFLKEIYDTTSFIKKKREDIYKS